MPRFAPILLGLLPIFPLRGEVPLWMAPSESAVISMAANASGRPRECAGPVSTRDRDWHPTVWDNAREPYLRRYCDLIGRAQAKLASSPTAAREIAAVADQILPGYAAPWVVRGRANVALHNFAEALQDFERARSIDPRCMEEPLALRDQALAQRQAGKLAEAMTTYHVLVPRLALLSNSLMRSTALLEAAAVAMALGADGLREAVALLTEARAGSPTKLDADVLALLALALDRSGSSEQARVVITSFHQRGYALASPRTAQSFPYLVDSNDAHAMLGIVFESVDPKQSAEQWEQFAAGAGSGPWAEHARRHLDSVRAHARARPAVASSVRSTTRAHP